MTATSSEGTVRAENRADRDSEAWHAYFQHNDQHLLSIPWADGADLSERQRKAVAASVQIFQLGESSEGFHLARRARQHSEQSGDPYYYEAIKLFIREEQRHARVLGRFMDMVGIPRIRQTWTDTVFRRLRHIADLEQSIVVLVTAEIMAKVYYPALKDATDSAVLRRICEQIIHDEGPHVEFQCQRVAILRKHCGPLALMIRRAAHRFLYFGTCFIVWKQHGSVFRAAGRGFRQYWKSCWQEFFAAEQIMEPRRPA